MSCVIEITNILCDVEAVKFDGLHFCGDLGVKGLTWDIYKKIFNDLESDVGVKGSAAISIGFNEKESNQDQDGCEVVSVRKTSGKLYFDYISNGSKINLDKDYALATFKKIFDRLSIPVLVESGEGFYTLKHAADLELRLSDGLLGRNPGSFFCEVPNESCDRLIDKLKIFLSEFTGGVVYSVDWSAGCGVSKGATNSRSKELIDIYNAVVKKQLPAEK